MAKNLTANYRQQVNYDLKLETVSFWACTNWRRQRIFPRNFRVIITARCSAWSSPYGELYWLNFLFTLKFTLNTILWIILKVDLQKNFFSALRASFCSKNKGETGPPGPSPGSVNGLFGCGYPVKDLPVFLSGLPPGTRSSENSLRLLGSSFVSARKSPALGISTTLCI